MPQDKEWFRQGANLGQQLGDQIKLGKTKIYPLLAGSDPETSETIGFFLVMGELGYIDLDDPSIKFLMAWLNVKRQALFATSEKTNEITKMGMQLPRSDDVYFDE